MTNVIVACKLPHGIKLSGYDIMGSNAAKAKKEADKNYPMPGGYALTEVDQATWNDWYKFNKDSDMVKRNLIFGDTDRSKVISKCMSFRRSRSGFEQGTSQGYKPY